ncbi:MAG: aspartate aminotransferase family protein [Thermoplasmatales archaeon]|jgi:acetylornithine/N-succinyldiaminopimelate aminotransferase|nr:aspartate aminotransferase family protein [Thermoplasmatales archaeon]
MNLDEIKEKSQKYLFRNYGRMDLSFTHGKGAYLYDTEGKEYLDLVAGIAVNSLGYAHPKWNRAVTEQISRLSHTSNLYYVAEQAILGEKLASVMPEGLECALFVNSGAEANEGAMKVAVRYTGKGKILSAWNSFHGRTAAALGATGQVKYQDTFQTLISGCFDYFDFGSSESVKSVIGRETAAVIVEPIQGEGGVMTAPKEFFRTVRDLCTDNGALMVVDEVQTGLGRTGKWFGIDHFGVVPDIITTAKALASGAPMGAVSTTEEISAVMTPGTHGTTFGGNPLVCSAAAATIDIMKEEGLVDNAAVLGAEWISQIRKIRSPEITGVRGMGLIMGMEMKSRAKEFQEHCLSEGILVNVCHGNVVRLIPPLIIGRKETDRFNAVLKGFLSA